MARILGISKAVSEAAEAASSFALRVPENANKQDITRGANAGDTVWTWAESGVIKQAYAEDLSDGATGFKVQIQISPGSANRGKMVFGNHNLDYNTIGSEEDPNSFRHSKAVTALKTLVRATGNYLAADGSVPPETLIAMFPNKGTGASPLVGKRVSITIADRGVKARLEDGPDAVDFAKRFQSIESYSPEV